MSLEYSVEVRNAGSGAIELVKVAGEVDLANAEELNSVIDAPNLAERIGIVMDLRLVPFMDSSGLGTLVRAAQRLGSRLVLVVAPASPVANLLGLSGVENMVNVATTEEQALGLLDGARPNA
jgi:anti-anti-sigma factor